MKKTKQKTKQNINLGAEQNDGLETAIFISRQPRSQNQIQRIVIHFHPRNFTLYFQDICSALLCRLFLFNFVVYLKTFANITWKLC